MVSLYFYYQFLMERLSVHVGGTERGLNGRDLEKEPLFSPNSKKPYFS